jgi:DNA polymerase-3 subunit beta
MMETEAVVPGTLKSPVADELAQARDRLARVSTRTTVQILAGILLRAADGELELAATDMELSLRTSLDGGVDEGSVVVPGRLLLELARLLPERR